MNYREMNMDGLVGPNHHYAGLSRGNIASMQHAHLTANPQKAALEGLKKMRLLHTLGVLQAVIPPHARPHPLLFSEFKTHDVTARQLQQAYKIAPYLFSACFSASSMWTANMATITPSLDTIDQRVHFTAANLTHHLHRAIEAQFSSELLKKIFANETYFMHHAPLFSSSALGDEGAANHSRLCINHSSSGLHLFVYGKTSNNALAIKKPLHYPARQTLEASTLIAHRHTLTENNHYLLQQNPDAIDQGVFHNDVISTVNENLFLLHEDAYVDQSFHLNHLQKKCDFPINIIEVTRDQLSIKEAVENYLFNSQVVTLVNGGMALIAPIECQTSPRTSTIIDGWLNDSNNPIQQVHYQNLQQSMQNGGGPACLRLRVVLSEVEQQHMHQGIIITDVLLDTLTAWVNKHYRDRLCESDLLDPLFIQESHQALDELTQHLQLGSIYSFQKGL